MSTLLSIADALRGVAVFVSNTGKSPEAATPVLLGQRQSRGRVRRADQTLLVAELKARGLSGWVVNSVEAPRITNQLCLPPWQPRSDYQWPPRK